MVYGLDLHWSFCSKKSPWVWRVCDTVPLLGALWITSREGISQSINQSIDKIPFLLPRFVITVCFTFWTDVENDPWNKVNIKNPLQGKGDAWELQRRILLSRTVDVPGVSQTYIATMKSNPLRFLESGFDSETMCYFSAGGRSNVLQQSWRMHTSVWR